MTSGLSLLLVPKTCGITMVLTGWGIGRHGCWMRKHLQANRRSL